MKKYHSLSLCDSLIIDIYLPNFLTILGQQKFNNFTFHVSGALRGHHKKEGLTFQKLYIDKMQQSKLSASDCVNMFDDSVTYC